MVECMQYLQAKKRNKVWRLLSTPQLIQACEKRFHAFPSCVWTCVRSHDHGGRTHLQTTSTGQVQKFPAESLFSFPAEIGDELFLEKPSGGQQIQHLATSSECNMKTVYDEITFFFCSTPHPTPPRNLRNRVLKFSKPWEASGFGLLTVLVPNMFMFIQCDLNVSVFRLP